MTKTVLLYQGSIAATLIGLPLTNLTDVAVAKKFAEFAGQTHLDPHDRDAVIDALDVLKTKVDRTSFNITKVKQPTIEAIEKATVDIKAMSQTPPTVGNGHDETGTMKTAAYKPEIAARRGGATAQT